MQNKADRGVKYRGPFLFYFDLLEKPFIIASFQANAVFRVFM